MAAPKHFVNDPTTLISSFLRSLPLLDSRLQLDLENKIVSRGPDLNVAIISGGGSGHEPSFAGFVGPGLLSASVAGSIFASPSSTQIQAAIEQYAASSVSGILVVVMNYTGDVLNFGLAVEKAKLRYQHLQIEMVCIGDDVAVRRSKAGKVGRRGIAGITLVHKIAGAMSMFGYKVDQIANVVRLVSRNLVSIGIALGKVHVPGRPTDEYLKETLGNEEVEIGLGIHNEPGIGRQTYTNLPTLVQDSLRKLLDDSDPERGFLPRWTERQAVLVNNLGGLSALELGAVVTEVVGQLISDYQIDPVRIYAGTFMASLDCRGFSISLLSLVDSGADHDLVSLLDFPTDTPAWTVNIRPQPQKNNIAKAEERRAARPILAEGSMVVCALVCDLEKTMQSLESGLRALIQAEPEITKYDTIVGDGDCGTTLRRGGEAILELLSSTPKDIVSLLASIASVIERTMDGTSGALYAIFTNSLAQFFKMHAGENVIVDRVFWVCALEHASEALAKYTPAKPGDRTLVDALEPFVQTLSKSKSISKAAKAASIGAHETASMKASLGRAVYVGGEGNWVGKVPDPGAYGLSKFLSGLSADMG